MKTCPACRQPMATEDYEGAKVWRCPACRGVFVAERHLQHVRRVRENDNAALKQEAAAEFKSDTASVIRCPRCSGHMDKRPISSRYTRLKYDYCRACDGIWFDGGELAIAQLVYEASISGRESLEFQERMRQLESSPDRMARFEEAMAALPDDMPSTVDFALHTRQPWGRFLWHVLNP